MGWLAQSNEGGCMKKLVTIVVAVVAVASWSSSVWRVPIFAPALHVSTRWALYEVTAIGFAVQGSTASPSVNGRTRIALIARSSRRA